MDQNNQFCRLCLSPTINNFVYIYENTSTSYNLAHLIKIYFSIEITEQDNFSKIICKQCSGTLIDFHNFVLSVKRNNESLINICSTNSVKKEKNDCEENTDDARCKSEDFNNDSDFDDFNDEVIPETKLIVELRTKVESSNSSDNEYLSIIQQKARKQKRTKLRTQKKIYPETENDAKIKKFYKFECPICKDDFGITSFRLLRAHFKTKHNVAPYLKCCDKKFGDPYALVAHIEEHLMPDSLKCPTCGKKLRTKQTLLLHMDRHVPVEERPMKCKYCAARFVRKRYLMQHEQIHLTDDQLAYVCDLCGKKYSTDCKLKTHLNTTHSNEKRYVCDICARAFKLKVQLQEHMYIHKKDAHKQCEQCGLWFKTPRTYSSHMKAKHDDSGPKSFPCSKCNHISPTKRALHAHNVNIHGPKKLSCTYCSEAFTSNNLLKSHLMKHTGPGEPFSCPHCPKVFRYRTGYYSHKRRVHPHINDRSYTKKESDIDGNDTSNFGDLYIS